MKKKILIAGVSGFIGRSFWQYLKKKKTLFQVFGIDARLDFNDKNIFCCNLTHSKSLQDILTRIQPDYIFHFAGGRMAHEKKLFEANILTTKSLLDVIQQIPHFHPRVIIPGSAAEYGKMPQGKKLIMECCEPKPLTWYGFVKLMQTNLGLMYFQRGMDIIVVRMFNIIGAGAPPSLVVGKFAQQIVDIEKGKSKKIIHTKNLEGRRDFLDIEDVLQALLLVVQKGKSGEIYNICSGQSIEINELLKKILSCAKVKDIVIKEDKEDASKSFDVIGSNIKLKAIANWSPKVSLTQSLKKTLQSYRRASVNKIII